MKDLQKKIAELSSKMPDKQVMYVEAYLSSFISRNAFIAVFGAKKTPAMTNTAASRVYRKVHVQELIQLRLAQRKEELHVDAMHSVNRCLQILDCDYAEQTEVFKNLGVKGLSPEAAKLIQGTKIKTRIIKNRDDPDEIETEYDITFQSKDKALDMLNKLGGQYQTRVDLTSGGKEITSMTDIARKLEEQGAIGNGTSTNGSK